MASSNPQTTPLDKSVRWPLWTGVLFILVITVGWLSQTPSREELFADTVKLWDSAKITTCGWSPSYLLGHSGQIYQSSGMAIFLAHVFAVVLGGIFGSFTSLKLLILCFIPASAFTMWCLMRRIGAGSSLAAWTALLYVILPSFHVAVGIYEHWTVGFCFVFAPLLLRGILAVAEEGSPREVVLLGLSAAALTLSYTKIAVVMSPVLLLWSLEILRISHHRARALLNYGAAVMVAILTGVMGDAAMFQIGLIPLAGLSLALGLPSLKEWRASQLGRWFLILTACWLLSIWFASGPDGILLGHIHILKTAQGLPDTSIPLLWLSLVWLGWLIYQTAFQLLEKRWIPSALIALLVLAMPIFRIAEFFPLFNDIRAPESFWSVGGFCCLAAAVGIAFWMLFTEVVEEGWRKPLAIAVGVLLLVELYPIHSAYWTRGMDRQLFTEFDQAAEFLKTAPIQGRVHPLSGRYFYLTLPEKAGRALDSEAHLRHFQLKWVRHLEVAGNASGESLKSYLNLAGVAYILLDKEDPYSPKQMQDFFRSIYPVVFENKYFAVLANQQALYPAFLAHDFVALPKESYAMAPAALQLLPQNLVTVELAGVDQNMPGFAGMAKGPTQIELLNGYQGRVGQPFGLVPLTGNRMDDYQRMTYQLPPTASGWLIVSEAYHPDWTVSIDGRAAEVHRAEGALLSTYVPPGSHEVNFQFKAPSWYSLCLALGTLSWIVALAAMLYLPSRWAPSKWREWWNGQKS